MAFARINNNVHHYVSSGAKSNPALLFANSLGTDLRIWDDVTDRLDENFRVVRYDKRGHGLSDAPPSPYSINDLAQDVAGVLDALEIEQAVLCGVSVGGLIAQAFALNYPEACARSGSVRYRRADRLRRILAATYRQWCETGGLQALESPTMERWFSPTFRARRSADIRGYSNMLLQTSVEGYIGTCCALRDADFRATLATVCCPTLVLCGAEDIATPPELGRELAELISGAQFSLIENAAHLPCIEQPEAF